MKQIELGDVIVFQAFDEDVRDVVEKRGEVVMLEGPGEGTFVVDETPPSDKAFIITLVDVIKNLGRQQ